MSRKTNSIVDASHQVPLTLSFGNEATMESFCVFPGNEAAYNYLKNSVLNALKEKRFLFVHGPDNSGKSHLFKASSYMAENLGMRSIVLDMSIIRNIYDSDSLSMMMAEMENNDVILLDNVDSIAGDFDLESEIFNLYNRWQSNRNSGFMAVASHNIPEKSGITKRDLVSRFSADVILSVEELPKKLYPEMLVLREKSRGGFLAPSRAKQISSSVENVNEAAWVIDRLDEISVIKKKLVTENMVYDVLKQLAEKRKSGFKF